MELHSTKKVVVYNRNTKKLKTKFLRAKQNNRFISQSMLTQYVSSSCVKIKKNKSIVLISYLSTYLRMFRNHISEELACLIEITKHIRAFAAVDASLRKNSTKSRHRTQKTPLIMIKLQIANLPRKNSPAVKVRNYKKCAILVVFAAHTSNVQKKRLHLELRKLRNARMKTVTPPPFLCRERQ